jgi:hypothetical protein
MPDDAEVEAERIRIGRRAAMKAALAGVAAAAVWQAPRLEGLSVAPDVAQAASCAGGTVDSPVQTAVGHSVGIGVNQLCWGGLAGNACTNRTVSAAIPGNNFGFDVNASGFVQNLVLGGTINNGSLAVTVNGIDPPFQSCFVRINPTATGTDCGGTGGTFFDPNPANTQLNFPNSQTKNLTFGCQTNVLAFVNSAHVTLTLTCTCA